MQGGPGKFAFVILAVLIIIDLYAFKGLRHITQDLNTNLKIVLAGIYWLIPVFITIMTIYISRNIGELSGGKVYYRTFYTFMGVMILFYVPKLILIGFELGNDIASGVIFLLKKINLAQNIQNIRYIRYVGATIAILLFFFTFYGIIYGKYHYKVNHQKLEFENLPPDFSGFKIIHISDWHIGSFYGRPKRIEEAVSRINRLKPDIILFTGDLVNNIATEVSEFSDILAKLDARHGVYSTLGNHDYGEYVRWSTKQEQVDNLGQLKKIQQDIGFQLLNNESIIIRNGEQQIGIAGVENWGLPPFPQHGDLTAAIKDIEDVDFKILMSHDPSHWDAVVVPQTDIDLTLSGHTHGMQFGINLKSFKWSPVKMKYPKWGGLYIRGRQKLFVSVGIGYIGFPGRVGIRPEIAVLELIKKN